MQVLDGFSLRALPRLHLGGFSGARNIGGLAVLAAAFSAFAYQQLTKQPQYRTRPTRPEERAKIDSAVNQIAMMPGFSSEYLKLMHTKFSIVDDPNARFNAVVGTFENDETGIRSDIVESLPAPLLAALLIHKAQHLTQLPAFPKGNPYLVQKHEGPAHQRESEAYWTLGLSGDVGTAKAALEDAGFEVDVTADAFLRDAKFNFKFYGVTNPAISE